MSDQPVPRDDRAWPRGSFAVSVALVLIAVAAAVGLGLAAAGRGALPATVVVAGFVAAFAFGLAAAVPAFRRSIAGHHIPGRYTLLQLAGMAAAFVVMAFAGAVGGAMLAGLIAGLLVANMWGIRTARANRAIVDAAEAAQARMPPPDEPAAPARTPSADVEPLGPALRHAVALERRRAVAWFLAGAVTLAGGLALDMPSVVPVTVGVTAAGVVVWVLRRLVGSWLARRDFERGTPPRRGYVVLLHDPAPRIIRPLLGVWSEPPAPRGGRLPSPQRVYRCDEERADLLSYQGSAVVHEAWVDTGRKPRWVAADEGFALPHRRALFGRWYLSSLIGGERPGPPRPLTVPPPHPDDRRVIESAGTVGSFAVAVAGRVAVLSVWSLILYWVA